MTPYKCVKCGAIDGVIKTSRETYPGCFRCHWRAEVPPVDLAPLAQHQRANITAFLEACAYQPPSTLAALMVKLVDRLLADGVTVSDVAGAAQPGLRESDQVRSKVERAVGAALAAVSEEVA